jgi:type III pantothenate kinase
MATGVGEGAALLAVDAGNTRVKWGLSVDGHWVVRGVVAVEDAGTLAAAWAALAPRPTCAWIANVAGDAMRAGLAQACDAIGVTPVWFAASAQAAGVTNGYAQPTQLGADRWAVQVALRARGLGACVAANAGTALTIDAQDATGRFVGGLILPGLDRMRVALARDAALLADLPGAWQPFPDRTGDAMHTAAIDAAAGAIARLRVRLARHAGVAQVPLVLTGGGAGLLLPHVDAPVEAVETLVLDGLVVAARAAATAPA